MCKYEQRSNWGRRPLKQTQLYYAALDAHVARELYKVMARIAAEQEGQPKGTELNLANAVKQRNKGSKGEKEKK